MLILTLLFLMEQSMNSQPLVPCTTDAECLALNPHIQPY